MPRDVNARPEALGPGTGAANVLLGGERAQHRWAFGLCHHLRQLAREARRRLKSHAPSGAGDVVPPIITAAQLREPETRLEASMARRRIR
jgi:hypothetical protein